MLECTFSGLTIQWRDMVHSLGGMMCSSLHEMEETNTIPPSHTFSPWGLLPENTSLLQGVISREGVCTNNLTPLVKMLPCPNKGLSQLLLPESLFDNPYHSLSVHLYYTEEEEDQIAIRIELYFSLVFDTRRWERKGFSISDLFGSGVTSLCPLSVGEESRVRIDLTELRDPHLLKVKSHKFVFSPSQMSVPFQQLLRNSTSVDPKFKWTSPQTQRGSQLFRTQYWLLASRYVVIYSEQSNNVLTYQQHNSNYSTQIYIQ